jgi:hypothetical protein
VNAQTEVVLTYMRERIEADEEIAMDANSASLVLAELSRARGVVETFYLTAINGAICHPPSSGDEFIGQPPNPDGKIRLFDVEALHCEPCKKLWREALSVLNVASENPTGVEG